MRRLPTLALATIVLSLAAIALPRQADAVVPLNTYVVTKTDDTNDGACDEDCSLREAVIASNDSSGLDRVQLGAGTFNLTILGANENAAATGDLDVTDDVIIDGANPDATVIDGDHESGVFEFFAGNDVTLRDLTVRDGGNPAETDANTGGIYTEANTVLENVVVRDNDMGGFESVGGVTNYGTLTIRNSRIVDNSVPGGQRGAAAIYSQGPLTIENSVISGNSAPGQDGVGAMWLFDSTATIINSTISGNSAGPSGIGGIYTFEQQLTLQDVTISGNSTGNVGVGGLFIDDGSTADVADSVITSNESFGEDAVGGVLVLDAAAEFVRTTISDNTVNGQFSVGGVWTEGQTTFTQSNVTNNHATGGNSTGGMYTYEARTSLDRVDIYENTAEGAFTVGGLSVDGQSFSAAGTITPDITVVDSEVTENSGGVGGILILEGQVADLDRVTVSGNIAEAIGGIFNQGLTNLTNVTISGNQSTAPNGIGAIYNPGNLLIAHSTIANNTYPGGPDGTGGVWDDGDLGWLNTVLANNTSENCVVGLGDPFSLGGNVDSGNTCPFNHVTDQSNTDPMLGPLAQFGGFVETHSLQSGSPAVDAAGDCDETVDARTYPRPAGPACDSGAYEANSPGADAVVWGDINCSGRADPDDALLTFVDDSGIEPDTGRCPRVDDVVEIDSVQHTWGDINCDAVVDAQDGIALLRAFGGLPYLRDPGCRTIGDAVSIIR